MKYFRINFCGYLNRISNHLDRISNPKIEYLTISSLLTELVKCSHHVSRFGAD
jgi:hypothetical protein